MSLKRSVSSERKLIVENQLRLRFNIILLFHTRIKRFLASDLSVEAYKSMLQRKIMEGTIFKLSAFVNTYICKEY